MLVRGDSLDSPDFLIILAHESGHYLLGHRAPEGPDATVQRALIEQQAWVKAVEVLHRVTGTSEEAALRRVLEHLKKGGDAVARGEAAMAFGHGDPCDEVGAVVKAFLSRFSWADAYACPVRPKPAKGSYRKSE